MTPEETIEANLRINQQRLSAILESVAGVCRRRRLYGILNLPVPEEIDQEIRMLQRVLMRVSAELYRLKADLLDLRADQAAAHAAFDRTSVPDELPDWI